MRVTRMAAAGLVALAAQPLAIVVELAAVAAVVTTHSAPYDLLHNTISDLGAVGCGTVGYPWGPVPVCSPWHTLVNASFVVSGLALVFGAWAVQPLLPESPLRPWAVGSWIVAGMSTVATGFVPLDVDVDLHNAVSTPVFLGQVALLLSGLLVRRHLPRLGWVGAGAGLVSVASALTYLLVLDVAPWGGLLERIALWPGSVWLAVLAAQLGRRAGGVASHLPRRRAAQMR